MMTPEEYRDMHWDEPPFWYQEDESDQEEDVEFDDEEEE